MLAGPPLPIQIFTDIVDLEGKHGTNICLHYDDEGRHLGHNGNRARMVCGEWGSPYAAVEAWLGRTGIGIPIAAPQGGSPVRFYLYPDLPISLISEKIANDFGLLQAGLPPFFFHVNPPFNQVMPALAGLPISGAWRVEATIKIRCPGVVAPSPARALEPFEFHIPDPTIAPPKLAVFGRNVIKRMLLLYQGQYRPVNALRNAPTKPRFYLGRNENPHI